MIQRPAWLTHAPSSRVAVTATESFGTSRERFDGLRATLESYPGPAGTSAAAVEAVYQITKSTVDSAVRLSGATRVETASSIDDTSLTITIVVGEVDFDDSLLPTVLEEWLIRAEDLVLDRNGTWSANHISNTLMVVVRILKN